MSDTSHLQRHTLDHPQVQTTPLAPSPNHESARYFVPLCEPNATPELIRGAATLSPHIGFNLHKLLHSKRLKDIRRHGLRDVFQIPQTTKIWVTTTAPDTWLERYYGAGLATYKNDVSEFKADFIQGPDLWMYREDGAQQNERDWLKAMEYQQQCVDLPGFVPAINGLNSSHFTRFVSTFQCQGFKKFILPAADGSPIGKTGQDIIRFSAN